MTRTRGQVPRGVLLLFMGLTACQDPGQRGPMERTGAYIDRKVIDTQRGMAEFSQRAGQGLDQAGRSVGAGAQRVGATVHDSLMPAADEPPSPPPSTAPGPLQPQFSPMDPYPRAVLPAPTRMSPCTIRAGMLSANRRGWLFGP